MNKEEIILKLATEFNVLYDLLSEQIDKKDTLKEASENGENNHSAILNNEFEIVETKIRIKELKSICSLFEIEWKTVRKAGFKID